MTRAPRRDDAGAGSILVLSAVALVWVAATWFVFVSGVAGERAAAAAAADLAALAGAAHGDEGETAACAAVREIAAANSASVRTCAVDLTARSVLVLVEVRGSGLLARFPPAIGRARAGLSG